MSGCRRAGRARRGGGHQEGCAWLVRAALRSEVDGRHVQGRRSDCHRVRPLAFHEAARPTHRTSCARPQDSDQGVNDALRLHLRCDDVGANAGGIRHRCPRDLRGSDMPDAGAIARARGPDRYRKPSVPSKLPAGSARVGGGCAEGGHNHGLDWGSAAVEMALLRKPGCPGVQRFQPR
jgi:hypothetical protein